MRWCLLLLRMHLCLLLFVGFDLTPIQYAVTPQFAASNATAPMRLYRVIALTAATLLAANLVVADSNSATARELPASARSLQKNVAPATRFLRADTTGDEDEEARGFNLKISSLETIKNSLRSTSRKQYQQLVKSGQSTDDAFTFLKLDKVGDQLLANRAFKVWEKYVSKVSTWKADSVMITKLQKQYGDAKLAEMLEAATKVKKTSKIAKRLQTAHFDSWLNAGYTHPNDVISKVVKVGSTTNPDSRPLIWQAYFDYLVNRLTGF